MNYFLEALAMPTWVWWLLVGQVGALVLFVAFGVGYVTGVDRARRERRRIVL
jgi:hypothetical protein